LEIQYRQISQERYQMELDLDKDYYHFVYPMEYAAEYGPVSFFGVYYKDNSVVVETGGKVGQANQRMDWVKNFLAKNYHFDVEQKPVWRLSCRGIRLQGQLISYSFRPAEANVLLVGDAGGFQLPVSGEGIGTGIKTGLLAADSIKEALETGGQPDKIYLTQIEGILSMFKEIYPWMSRIVKETEDGGYSLPQVLRDAYNSTLRMF